MLILTDRTVQREENPRCGSKGVGVGTRLRRPYRTYYSATCSECGRVVKVRADNIKKVLECRFCRTKKLRKKSPKREQALTGLLVRTLNNLRTKPFRECACCGTMQVLLTREKAYCSRACRKRAWAAAFENATAVCRVCDRDFKPMFYQQTTCSFYCKKLKDKRRSLPRTILVPLKNNKSTFSPVSLLERDNWTCQVCTFPAPRHLRGTYSPIAPEVGHIIAHADGGDYVPANLQCEHRCCNLAKNSLTR